LCKSNLCEKYGHKKYEDYCLFCFVNLYPDNQIVRNYKTKERDVVDRIQKIYPDFTWIHDKKIQDGCSLKRPDLLLDLGSHIIIIEVDENAHSDYDCSCENKRLMLLSQDVGHRSIVFIRFNPDDYIDKDGNKIKSCWKINNLTGLLTIEPKKISEWEERINILIEQIKYWIENQSEKMIEIIQLFYS
jgi:Zn-finger protein